MVASISKEAGFKEVLNEVSILDLAQILKQTFASIGCFGFFVALSALFGWPDGDWLGIEKNIPMSVYWVFWVVIVWAWLATVTDHKSYHEIHWYFPRLRWWASLLLAAYLVGYGGIYYASWRSGMKLLVSLAYTSPFMVFMMLLEVGHAKLMEKRLRGADAID